MSIDDPLLTLDIIGGSDVISDNCVLRKNKTELVCRSSYDFCQSTRDEMIVNRGYDLPPYHQEEWAFDKQNHWTPEAWVAGSSLLTWFSPEYFHPETSNTTLCVQMENRATGSNATGNAEQINLSSMPSLTTTAGRHRGLAVLDFDGGSDFFNMGNTGDWSVGTYDWFCCIMLHGPHTDTNDIQHIVEKGARFNLTHDWTGLNRHAVFNYGDANSFPAASITVTGGAQISSQMPTIYSFGRFDTGMFLRVVSNGDDNEQLGNYYAGDMSQASKPKIGYNTIIGEAQKFDGEFVELIFVAEEAPLSQVPPIAEVSQANMLKVEGYLAHKYGVAKDILPTDHTYYSEPPRL